MQYGLFYLAKGDWEPSKEHFEKGIKHSEEAKYALGSAMSWSGLGYACAMLGDRETGKRHAEKGLEIHRDSGVEAVFVPGSLSLRLDSPGLGRSKKCPKPCRRGTEVVSKE